VVIGSDIKVLETAGDKPKEFIARVRAVGVKIVQACTAVRHAILRHRRGADPRQYQAGVSGQE
jgi:NADH:quinone reductase (non-electrogenic)